MLQGVKGFKKTYFFGHIIEISIETFCCLGLRLIEGVKHCAELKHVCLFRTSRKNDLGQVSRCRTSNMSKCVGNTCLMIYICHSVDAGT